MVIVKDFGRLKERYSVLLFVLPGFLGVPFKYEHGRSYGNLTFRFCRAVRAA